MSATNRGSDRRPDDFYATPGWVVRAIVPHLPMSGVILDPCAGNGSLLSAIASHRTDLDNAPVGIEIDELRSAACMAAGFDCECADALSVDWSKSSLIITNPPFSLALEFVSKAIAEAEPHGGTVAMLLRLNWLASQERAPFHRKHPADIYVLPRRPSFTGDGKSDSTEYAWFVFGPGRGGRWSILDVESRVRAVR